MRCGEAFFLALLQGEEQLAKVALEQVLGEAGFLGGAFDELAPLAVAVEVEAVDVHQAALFHDAQGDFHHFEG